MRGQGPEQVAVAGASPVAAAEEQLGVDQLREDLEDLQEALHLRGATLLDAALDARRVPGQLTRQAGPHAAEPAARAEQVRMGQDVGEHEALLRQPVRAVQGGHGRVPGGHELEQAQLPPPRPALEPVELHAEAPRAMPDRIAPAGGERVQVPALEALEPDPPRPQAGLQGALLGGLGRGLQGRIQPLELDGHQRPLPRKARSASGRSAAVSIPATTSPS